MYIKDKIRINLGVVSGGPDGCRPYSVKTECGTPCSPSEYPHSESLRKCQKKCQSSYYKDVYDNDKKSGLL